MQKIGYNQKQFFRNFPGLWVVLFVVYLFLQLIDNHFYDALFKAFYTSVLASGVISLGVFLWDKRYLHRLNIEKHRFIEEVEHSKFKDRFIQRTNGDFLIRSNLLFGDIQGKFEEGFVVLTGSKYQLRKFLDAVNLS
ncbi:hypothetical protein [Membranihabitans maritimus]|uniref:hypothetical protein n=1 Tax=Membranihabitans maritimus TaxID=2904244 RepID=UPI001F3F3B19|nr:hypothetical protein [Membranihabitans maritimus]